MERKPIKIPYKVSGVYQIKCLINDKVYIGSSKDIKCRWKGHINTLNKRIHENPFLQSDWDIYGGENFEFSVIEFCSESEKLKIEQKVLDEYCGDVYNIAKKVDAPTRESSVKKKISNALKGRVFSEDTKRKLSENHADFSGSKNPMYGSKRVGEENPMWGKSQSKETRKKISERYWSKSEEERRLYKERLRLAWEKRKQRRNKNASYHKPVRGTLRQITQ